MQKTQKGGIKDSERLDYLFGLLRTARERAPKREHSMALWQCGEFREAVGYYGRVA